MKDDKNDFLSRYAIKNVTDEDFDAALKGKATIPGIVSLPSKKRDAEDDLEELEAVT